MSYRERSSGFTLLEIMVALAILGLGLAASLQVFSGGLKNIHKIDMAHQAAVYGQKVMNEILSDQSIRQPTSLSGTLDSNFSYTAMVDYWQEPQTQLSLNPASLGAELLSVRVDIQFTHDPYGKIYRVVSMKLITEDSGVAQPADPSEAIRQLFGGGRQ